MTQFEENFKNLIGQRIYDVKAGQGKAVRIETVGGYVLKLRINYEDIDLEAKAYQNPVTRCRMANDELKDFTKNDWMAFAGATKFRDGSEPQIYSYGFLTLIADGEGVSAMVDAYKDDRAYMIDSDDELYTLEMADEIIKNTKRKTKEQMIRYFEKDLGLKNNM